MASAGIIVLAMPSRRDQIVMTEAEIEAYLTEQRILNVATNGPTGHPHLVAMWFTLVDGKPAFWTFGRSQKIVNIRRDDKISGLVESGESYNELRGVEMTGQGAADRGSATRSSRSARRSPSSTPVRPPSQPTACRSSRPRCPSGSAW